MDATQAIIFSDEEESDEEPELGQKKAVAFLHVLAQRDISASKHPIYEGDNFIGRHDSNSIHMPYKALSKQHACIEVQGNSHLIYDMESRNKTRRGKMFLKPNVRYELRDGDNIIFGDVKCQYIPAPEEDDDDETGSETDSELMLQPPDSEETGQDDKYSKEDENENESSFNLNDFLQPTQPCVPSPKLEFKTPCRLDQGKVFAADSDDESPNKSNTGEYGNDSSIPETQLSAKKKNDVSVVAESDSDTDIDETGPFDVNALASAQTQAVVATQAIDNMATLAVDNMATQAVDDMATQAVDNMATLAVDSAETQAIDNMATLAVDNMATQAVDDMATLAVDNMATQAVDDMATLAVDNMATQAVDDMATLAVDNMATQAVDDMATLAVDNMATQAVDDMATLAVDNMATQAVDDMATLAVDNMATQAVDDMATLAVDNMATQAVDNMATQAVDNMATLAVDNMATQAVDNMATQAVDNMATLAVDSAETQAIDNMATLAVDNMATQAVNYTADSDSSDTDVDEVRQSLLEAPTQAVGLNDSRQHDAQTLVLDSSAASSDADSSPVKQASRGRNIYDEPTQACDGLASDSGSETDIEGEGMEAETQAVMRDDENKLDEDKEDTMKSSSDKTAGVEDMATVPLEMGDGSGDDDDDTDVEGSDGNGVKDIDSKGMDTTKTMNVEDMATVPIAMAEDDDDDTDVEEGNRDGEKKGAIKDAEVKDGNLNITREDEGNLLSSTAIHDGGDSTEIESEADNVSQEYFLNYRTEQNPAEKEPPEIEATQPYGGPAEDAEEEASSNHGDDVVYEATQPYGAVDDDETPAEPTSVPSVTLEMSSTLPYGAEGETKQPDSHDDETDPTVPYEAVEDMETAESEVECTQAYGMQGSDTQVPDSQDGDEDQANTSSRFPVFKTQSPSRSCLKQPNTPERKATRARRVTFEPADSEELDGSDEDDRGRETKRKVSQSRRQPKDKKSSEEQSTSTRARKGRPRGSQGNEDEGLETTGNDEAIGGRSTRSRGGNDKVLLKRGQKRKVQVQEPAAAGSTAPSSNDESTSAKRGRRQRGGKVEEEPDGGQKSVDDALTVTDAKPTRKKEFDAENPRPSRQGSKVKDERKLSDSSISSVGSEGSRTERALQAIVQIGKKLKGIRRGKKTSEGSEENAAHHPVPDSVGTRRSQRTAKVVDDGESDDTASISSTASSVKDFAEVEPSTRPRRGTRSQKMSEKVPEEPNGPLTPLVRTSRRGGVAKEGTAHSQDNAKKPGRSTRRGDAVDTIETEADGQSTQLSSRTRRRGGAKGDEAASQDDGERIGSGEKTASQNEEELGSKRTRKGTAKTDTQEEAVGKRSMETVDLKSKAVKQSTRGKSKNQSVGDSAHDVQEETSVQEAKESNTTTRRTRRGLSESQEESIKDAEVSNVRQSGRRRTMPARFLDSEGTGKDSASEASSSKQETRDAGSTNASVFAMPKPVGKPSKQKQQKEPLSSPQKESEVETAQTTTRGRRSAVKVPETTKEKGRSEPLEKDSGERRKRGQQAKSGTSSSKEESKAEGNITTSVQRGRRATTKISEASAEKGKSEDVKGSATNKKGRHVTAVQQKTAEDPETHIRNMASPTSRGRKAASPASATQTPRDSKGKERKDQSTEDKSPEVPVTRGKRGATATPPPSSPAKKPRQTDQMVAHSPSLRRRVSDARPKVMFTGVMDDSWQKTVTTLGGELVDSVHDCTHLITDKVRRTVKFLCCVARGVIILTPKWLDESKAAKMFIDTGPFQLKDKASERQYGFNLPTSLQKASQSRLLTGYKIHVTPGVKPEPQQMKDIIKCAGGEYVAKLPTKSIPQMVVVSCEGDKSLWAGPTKAGIPVVSSEFILTGILRQEILLKDYKLK